MKFLDVDTDEPICAIATPLAPSALGIVRFTGKNSLNLFVPLFSKPKQLQKIPHRSAIYGSVLTQDGKPIDDVVVLVWREGGGYTGQEGADIIAHGNPVILLSIVEALIQVGFRQASPGEFTLRAFLNGKLDLTQAEAVNSLIHAKTAKASELALKRLHGVISKEINEAKNVVLEQLAQVNIQLDYDEDDVDTMRLNSERLRKTADNLQALAATCTHGLLYQDGIKVALTGAVNAGKSSLFNRFLQEERSIVSEEAGTTRDFLEGWINLEGVPLRLFDTAGLRETESKVESEGIRRSLELAESADLLLVVVDGTHPEQPPEAIFQKPHLKIWNKVDLSPNVPPGYVGVSAHTGAGWQSLIQELKQLINRLEGTKLEGGLSLDSLRQRDLIQRAIKGINDAIKAEELGLPHDMIALDLQEALNALGEITGEVTTDDILKTMFSGFCVGK